MAALMSVGTVATQSLRVTALPLQPPVAIGQCGGSYEERLKKQEKFFEWLRNFNSTSSRAKVAKGWTPFQTAIPRVKVHLPKSGVRLVEQSATRVVFEIDTRDAPLQVTLETFAVPRRTKITRAGALAIPFGSLTTLDKFFGSLDQERWSATSIYGAQGLGAWLGRPAYNRSSAWNADAEAWRVANPGGTPTNEQMTQFCRVTHVRNSNAIAIKSGKKYRLLRATISGSPTAFAHKQAIGWRLLNSVRVADKLSPPCRFDHRATCNSLGMRSRSLEVPEFLFTG